MREIFFKRVQLDRLMLGDRLLMNPVQLDLVTNEIFINQALMIKDLLDLAC